MDILKNSLHVHNGFNGYYLYGVTPESETVMISCLGDGTDNDHYQDYDPNDDYDLPDAYNFNLVDGTKIFSIVKHPEATHFTDGRILLSFEDRETAVVDLPHGSGIDDVWSVDETDDNYELSNSYHAMNDYGTYIGWIDFTVDISKLSVKENIMFDVAINANEKGHEKAEEIDLISHIEESVQMALEVLS